VVRRVSRWQSVLQVQQGQVLPFSLPDYRQLSLYRRAVVLVSAVHHTVMARCTVAISVAISVAVLNFSSPDSIFLASGFW
jgi:hypothetical protein